MKKKANVLTGGTTLRSTWRSQDLYWRTRFSVIDQCVLIEIEGGKSIFVVPTIEVHRAEKEAHNIDRVIDWHLYMESRKSETEAECIPLILKEEGITDVVVPYEFPAAMYAILQKYFSVHVSNNQWMFYSERRIKDEWEVAQIKKSVEAAEYAMAKACDFIGLCTIRDKMICAPSDSFIEPGEIVTSEAMKAFIEKELNLIGYDGLGVFVASGVQSADPHDSGSGPLYACVPIIFDIAPMSKETGYFGDFTRVLFKGEPRKDFQNMYLALLEGHAHAGKYIRPGVSGHIPWHKAKELFDFLGYPTDIKRTFGCRHGVGHGLGLRVHELPRLTPLENISTIIEAGNVLTNEPGLYYPQYAPLNTNIPLIGGMRIQDVYYVEKDGNQNLTSFPKDLNSMIL